MRLLTRYILFDLIHVFLLMLTGFTLLIFVALVGKEAVDKGIGLGPLLRMTPYLLPQAMQFAVPATMLLATTYVYGRLAGYNEIVAMKSLGISPFSVIWPTLALAAVVSFGAVVLNDMAVSWGRLGVQRVFIESLEEVAYGQLRMHKSYSSGGVDITVEDVVDRTLVEPTMVVKETEDRPLFTIRAREAELQASPDEGKLVVRFEQLRGIGGQIDIEWPETFEHVMSLDELTGNSSSNQSPSTVALGEIPDAKRRLEESIAHIEQQMTADATFGLLTGQFDALSKESWASHEKKLSAAEYRLQRLHTEPYRRWAGGFSCLCFVMIGAPMAIRLRHSEFLASFFACFLPILLIYYPLLMVSVDKAKSGELPPQAVWLGNIVLCVWGFWLMRRVMRY